MLRRALRRLFEIAEDLWAGLPSVSVRRLSGQERSIANGSFQDVVMVVISPEARVQGCFLQNCSSTLQSIRTVSIYVPQGTASTIANTLD